MWELRFQRFDEFDEFDANACSCEHLFVSRKGLTYSLSLLSLYFSLLILLPKDPCSIRGRAESQPLAPLTRPPAYASIPGMESQELNTDLFDLVEERMILRKRMPELDTLIREAILAEHNSGTPMSVIAHVVGVSRQRISQIVNLYDRYVPARLYEPKDDAEIEAELARYRAALAAESSQSDAPE